MIRNSQVFTQAAGGSVRGSIFHPVLSVWDLGWFWPRKQALPRAQVPSEAFIHVHPGFLNPNAVWHKVFLDWWSFSVAMLWEPYHHCWTVAEWARQEVSRWLLYLYWSGEKGLNRTAVKACETALWADSCRSISVVSGEVNHALPSHQPTDSP